MTSVIPYKISSSFYSLPKASGQVWNNATLKAELLKGLHRYKDFFEVSVRAATSADPRPFTFHCDDGAKWNPSNPTWAWAWYLKEYNAVVFNSRLKWKLSQVEMGIAHEVGHGLVTYNHFDGAFWADYPGTPWNYWSHLMKGGAGSHFHFAFSPREVKWCVDKKLFKLNSRPVHPFTKIFHNMSEADKAKNLAKLKKIVIEYTKLGMHAALYKWQDPYWP